MKKCTKCEEIKEDFKFSNSKKTKDGLRYCCNLCDKKSRDLLNTFPKHFNGDTALEYQRQPERIANKVYANRMGNGDEDSGEGWKYKGRGYIQLTGKENYFKLSNDTDIDFLHDPDLLLEEPNAIIGALWFWKTHNISIPANKEDVTAVTKIINGGKNGLEERKALFLKWKAKIK